MFSIEFLNALRAAEVDRIAKFLRPGARLLEIGAGTGLQSKILKGTRLRSNGYRNSIVRLFKRPNFSRCGLRWTNNTAAGLSVQQIAFIEMMFWNTCAILPQCTMRYGAFCDPAVIACTFCQPRVAFLDDVDVLSDCSHRIVQQCAAPCSTLLVTCARIAAPSTGLVSHHPSRVGTLPAYTPTRPGNAIGAWLFHPSWWRRNIRENGFDVTDDGR